VFSVDKNTTTDTITLSQTATAGMTLVMFCTGGATITAHLQTGGGTAFTRRGRALGTLECAIFDVACAGGETQVVLTLSGASNESGIIYHFPSLGAFISSGNNGAGLTAGSQSAQDFTAVTSAFTVAQNAVMVGGWSILYTGAGNAITKFLGLGPLGAWYGNALHQTGSSTPFFGWASGLADITSSASFPASQAAGSYKPGAQWIGGNGTGTGTIYAVAAAYADSSGIATNPAPANAIVAENSLPGTQKANWYLSTSAANDTTIAGYCDKLSYAPGDTVNFKVDSTSNPFRVEIYRLGFYSYETYAARNVLGVGTTTDAGYITGTVTSQSAPSVDGTLGSTSCAWATNATWTVPSNAAPGVYAVIFRRTDVTTHTCAGAFIVHSSTAQGQIAVCLADFTWHAYNVWGATTNGGGNLGVGTWTGRSVYQIGTDGVSANLAHRAYAVCFDRPYSTFQTDSLTFLYDTEQPLIAFLEAQGYDLVYFSNIDLENDTGQTLLTTAKCVALLGHQEYWTTNVYNSLTAARNAGVNFMIQSSNTALWHTMFAAADTNKRTMICYKDSTSIDVTPGFTGTGINPVSYTGTWRDFRTPPTAPNNTDVRRENALTGQLFVFSGPINVAGSVPFASKGQPAWRNSASIQALTTGNSYTNTQNTAGDELDEANGSSGQPPNLVNLSVYTVGPASLGANAVGDIYTTTYTANNAGFTLYRAASRGLVFNTGSWRGWWGISRFANSTFSGTPDVNWQNALLAIMYDLDCPPNAATCMQPANDTNVTTPSTGAPAAPADKTGVARAYGLRCPEDGQFMAAIL
jgi:hypothetical protein